MYVENGWLSLNPIYLSLLHPYEFSDNFADMDGFQNGGYIWAQGVLQYHLIEVPCNGWIRIRYSLTTQHVTIIDKGDKNSCRPKKNNLIWFSHKNQSKKLQWKGEIASYIYQFNLAISAAIEKIIKLDFFYLELYLKPFKLIYNEKIYRKF